MLRLNASYSKKVPAEGEYTSQSYHASVEVELSDALAPEQIKTRIHETFVMVKEAVESELHGKPKAAASPATLPAPQPIANKTAAVEKASNKQIKYLTDLANKQGYELSELNARVRQQFGVMSLYDLDKKQASALLDELNQKKAA